MATEKEILENARRGGGGEGCHSAPKILLTDGTLISITELARAINEINRLRTVEDCPTEVFSVTYAICDPPINKTIPLRQTTCVTPKLWVLYTKEGTGVGGIDNGHQNAAAYNAAHGGTFTYLGLVGSGEMHPMLPNNGVAGWFLYAVMATTKPVNDANGAEWFIEEGYSRAAYTAVNPDPTAPFIKECYSGVIDICIPNALINLGIGYYQMPTDAAAVLAILQAQNGNIIGWGDAGFCTLETSASDPATEQQLALAELRKNIDYAHINSEGFLENLSGWGYTNYSYRVTSFVVNGVAQITSPVTSPAWTSPNQVYVPKQAAGRVTVANYNPTVLGTFFKSDRNILDFLNGLGVSGFKFLLSPYEDNYDFTQSTQPVYGDGLSVDTPLNTEYTITVDALLDGVQAHTFEFSYTVGGGVVNKIDGGTVVSNGTSVIANYIQD